jgi:hypothetical protein
MFRTTESVTMYEKHLAMRELWANWDNQGVMGQLWQLFTGESLTMYENHLAMRELWANCDNS